MTDGSNRSWSPSAFARKIESGSDPLALLVEFADEWYGTGTPVGFPAADLDRAEARLGIRLPRALRRWYEVAGRSKQLIDGNSDPLIGPDEFQLRKGRLDIQFENQCVWTIFLREEDLGNEDPPVFEDYGGDVKTLSPSVSMYALQWALYTVKFASTFNANAETHGRDVSVLLSNTMELPVPPLNVFPIDIRFRAAEDVIVEIQDSWYWVGARSEEALARTMRWVDVEWDGYVGNVPLSVWQNEGMGRR